MIMNAVKGLYIGLIFMSLGMFVLCMYVHGIKDMLEGRE